VEGSCEHCNEPPGFMTEYLSNWQLHTVSSAVPYFRNWLCPGAWGVGNSVEGEEAWCHRRRIWRSHRHTTVPLHDTRSAVVVTWDY
jgi:hypothetical protein